MTTSYDIPRPFEAVEGEHGQWTVQARMPEGMTPEYVLIECSRDCAHAQSKAGLLNEIVAAWS